MNTLQKHLIYENASVLEAMKILNSVPENLTLFVLDSNGKMVGSVTDGDIRRGFIAGNTLDDPISKFMLRDFHYINSHSLDVEVIRSIREKGIKLLPALNRNSEIEKIYDLNKYRSILPLECMIMAGGRGERLRPLTDKVPKPLLEIAGKPIIEHNIDRLISYGIEKIYISVKYLGQQIVDYLGDGASKGIQIEYIWEDKPLGTAGALSLVPEIKSDYLLLMNSDIFTNIDFEDLYLQVINQNATMGIASTPYTVNIPYAIFEGGEYNRVIGFEEKPSYTNYTNAGIYLFEKTWIDDIPRNTFFNITDLLEIIIKTKGKVIHNPIVGYWIDIGKIDDYNKAAEIGRHI